MNLNRPSRSLRLALAAMVAGHGATASAQLRGDPQAVALASRMIDSIGGAKLWSGAKHLRIEERAYSASRPEGDITLFCRDLDQPRLLVIGLDGQRAPDFVVGQNEGWIANAAGTLERMSSERLLAYRMTWPRNIYVMYHRLARQDPRLTLSLVDELEFAVHENGEEIGRFTVDPSGHAVRWFARSQAGGRDEDWIYGPGKNFGTVSFPDWGTRRDGSYRFYYTRVELSGDTLSDAIFANRSATRDCAPS